MIVEKSFFVDLNRCYVDPNPEDHEAVGIAELLPPLPDILNHRGDFDLFRYAIDKPGDVVVFHPHTLHGGGPVTPDFPERHTLALRFFGDDCVYSPLPHVSELKTYRDLVPGAHFSKNPRGFCSAIAIG